MKILPIIPTSPCRQAGRNTTSKKIKSSSLLDYWYLFVVFVVFVVFPQKTFADDFSVGVYPPILQITTTPPTAMRHDITLKNLSDGTINLHAVFKPFTSSGSNNGEVEYLSPQQVFESDPQIFDKIQLLDGDTPVIDITLGPKEQKTLTVHIGLPQGEPPGDYYFSIVFTSKNSLINQKNGSSILGGIATNILLSVGPKSPTRGFLEEFSAPWFLYQGPVPFTVLIHNLSTHFIIPKGQILIRNMFGQLIGKVELLQVNVLENSSRYIPDSDGTSFTKAIWNQKTLFGIYRANLVISLSPEGPILLKTIYFIALPLPYIFGIIIAIIILTTIVMRVRKRIA